MAPPDIAAYDRAPLVRHAARLIQLRHWDAAGAALLHLALQHPADATLRARLVYVRGQGAATAGDLGAARRAWHHALHLDATLTDARLALQTLPPPRPWARLWATVRQAFRHRT